MKMQCGMGKEIFDENNFTGIWHPTGGHQNVPAGQRTENKKESENRGLRQRTAPADAGSGAGGLSGETGLRSVHYERETDVV